MNPDIYHITHINNLASIIEQDGLWSDSLCTERQLKHQNIGYSHIKSRRLSHIVNVARGGFIGDYVPFNFCPRSVMLYVVKRGHEHYNGGQDNILHLVSDIATVRQNNPCCFFTDIHADLQYAEQIDDFERLRTLNWQAIQATYWQSVKEEKQAEFLAHRSVVWKNIKGIGVNNHDIANRVQHILAGIHHQPEIKVLPNWYY